MGRKRRLGHGLRAADAVPLDAVEEGQQAIVVLLRERVDLVIVAASAVDRQAEKDLAGGGDDVVQLVVKGLDRGRPARRPTAQAVVAGGDEALRRSPGPARRRPAARG